MIRIHLERSFKTSPEMLWELVVDADHYRFWTEAFSEGSDFDGDWSKDSKIRFITEDENGNENGMVSKIVESTWPESISIHHLGVVMNGVEDYESPISKEWESAYENYRFTKQADGMCTFEMEMDLPEAQADEFKSYWDKAFERMALCLETSADVGKVITIRERSLHKANVIWDKLVDPEKLKTWNFASDDWHCPQANNDLKIGGEFHYTMAAKDGSMSFDFWGTYSNIEVAKKLYFKLGDGRNVRIDIIEKPYGCLIEERFEAENQNNLHLQRMGWQNILRNLAH